MCVRESMREQNEKNNYDFIKISHLHVFVCENLRNCCQKGNFGTYGNEAMVPSFVKRSRLLCFMLKY